MDKKHLAVLQVAGFEKPLLIPFEDLLDLANRLEIVAEELRNALKEKP